MQGIRVAQLRFDVPLAAKFAVRGLQAAESLGRAGLIEQARFQFTLSEVSADNSEILDRNFQAFHLSLEADLPDWGLAAGVLHRTAVVIPAGTEDDRFDEYVERFLNSVPPEEAGQRAVALAAKALRIIYSKRPSHARYIHALKIGRAHV